MAPLPGWAYLLVGALISGYSWFVRQRTGSVSLTFFFWTGILLGMIGLSKLLITYMTGPGGSRAGSNRPAGSEGALDGSGAYRVCRRCNARLHPQSRFCNWCGARL